MLKSSFTMAGSFEVRVSTQKQQFSNFVIVLILGNFKAEDDSFVFF